MHIFLNFARVKLFNCRNLIVDLQVNIFKYLNGNRNYESNVPQYESRHRHPRRCYIGKFL